MPLPYLRLSPLYYFPGLYFRSITVELVMLKRFFITGTDTSVGKTVVSRALLQALASGGKSVAGYKPVAKGSKETAEGMRNKDALVLQSVSSLELPYEAINPIALSEEESSVAHSCPINYTLLSNGLASLSDKVDHVVVEGTGGWRSLMNDLRPLSEWVVQEQLPVLMVVGIQEGCINHALLTAQAVANDGLPLIGWVANRINPGLAHYAEIIDVLGKKLPAPLIGELPYLPRAEQRELGQYIRLSMLGSVLAVDRIMA
ncbi:dithiobiotin synthetase [Salmonella enterica subsp. enterica serovar Agona str. 24249]|nr:dithiobiotin synthetase [Salmonella enterica subsp. enterica serovar Agona str. 24249]AHB93474.1 dithiobiotin synthetase [Salmonella enterica subsp. enterica serovar Heidelberg str. CFSAN002064]ETE43215.1 dithiobiotin synthetase [Salmonella enterica subsp. enterica serovar Infantis str. 335-3]